MRRLLKLVGVTVLLGTIGCADTSQIKDAVTSSVEIDASKYLLSTEPEGAIGVSEARENAKDQDDIVLVGRIGGGSNPWIADRAAFLVIDASMTVVSNGQESEAGEVCLDDCCASLRAECTTLVKILGDDGTPLRIDARKLLDAQENDVVVINGTVHRNDEQGSFTIAANGVYLRR